MSVLRKHIALNTLLVAASFGLAAAAGLGRNMVLAARFGVGADLDAYYAAFKVPEFLFTVVAGGALVTSFIPVVSRFLAREDREGAWRLASSITNIVLLVAAVLSLLAGIAAPWLIKYVVAPGFEPAIQSETVSLMRMVLVSTLIFAISTVQGSMLHGFKHFLAPALAVVLYPMGIAAGAYWLAPIWGTRGLAFGAIGGSLLHLSVKIPMLIRYGFRWRPILDLKDPAVRRVAVLMVPRVLDLAAFQLTLVALTNLASRLDAGSVTALEWGWSFMQLPETMIGTAFGLVALPTLSELAACGDTGRLRDTLAQVIGAVFSLAVPAALGLVLLGRPLLAVLYQRGSFDAGATEAVYVALRFYALGLVGHAALELAARAFFAQEDMITPLILAVTSAVLNIGLAILLMGPLGHGGLALSNSIIITAEVLCLLLILRHRWKGVGGRYLLALMGRVAAASALMGAAVWGSQLVGGRAGMGAVGLVLLGAMVGGGVYLMTGLLLGIDPLRWPLQMFRSAKIEPAPLSATD